MRCKGSVEVWANYQEQIWLFLNLPLGRPSRDANRSLVRREAIRACQLLTVHNRRDEKIRVARIPYKSASVERLLELESGMSQSIPALLAERYRIYGDDDDFIQDVTIDNDEVVREIQ